jgi:hypothetical protein
MRLSLPRTALLALGAAVLGSAITAPAFGFQCPTPGYLEVWVDPLNGDDATGLIGDPTLPVATINRAINLLDADPNLDATTNGIVHALPGLYSNDNAIPQTFPITMQPFIHVQGAGAKECVLRVRPGSPGVQTFAPYWPNAAGLTRRPGSTIAVDFTYQDELNAPSMLDGFTIQGADFQVYAETELHPRAGIVSNCVFDMRHGGDEMLEGPYFGCMIAAIYFGESGIDYMNMPFYLFNNTFLQGVRYGDGLALADTARVESVGICNLNDPSPGTLVDPNQTIRGVSDLHIQNNLFRCLDSAPRTAMLGIGSDDTQVIVSSRIGTYNTNAFNAGLVGGSSVPGGRFAVAIPLDPVLGTPLTPIPVVDMAPADPGFVGEFLSDTSTPAVRIRDARLLPDSVLLDMGASPDWAVGACTADFTAGNGMLYVDVTRDSALSSFDFDGDGHGNLRIVGDDIDVGFHEIDFVTQAGSFGNDTKSHFLPYDALAGVDSLGVARIPTGRADRSYIFGAPTLGGIYGQPRGFDPTLPQVWTTTGPWTHMPGSVAFRTNLIDVGTTIGIPGVEIWMDFIGLLTGVTPQAPINFGTVLTTATPFTNLESGQAHVPNVYTWIVPETPATQGSIHFIQEVFYYDAVLDAFRTANHLAEYL